MENVMSRAELDALLSRLPRKGNPSYVELDALWCTAVVTQKEGITDELIIRVVFESFWRILRKRASLPQDITQDRSDWLRARERLLSGVPDDELAEGIMEIQSRIKEVDKDAVRKSLGEYLQKFGKRDSA